MFYFLVIVLPVALSIGYLIFRNNQLKAIYKEASAKLLQLYAQVEGIELSDVEAVTSDYVVRTEGIRKLETALLQLEKHLNVKAKSISNTYLPKIEMLKIINKRLDKLTKQLVSV